MKIPEEVQSIIHTLQESGFEAYVVGGCVRDLLLWREPEDWDVTTNATPEQIRTIFPESFYENKFFTVTVRTGSESPRLKEVEVTTYRTEFEYRDRRRPERLERAKRVEEDLARRDFTINAIALQLSPLRIVDPFDGQKDLQAKTVRAVGNARERFAEDALRMMRAVRIATQLGFVVEEQTKQAVQANAALLKEIAAERVRDELLKIIMAERARAGMELLEELGLLRYTMPELAEGIGVAQNKHHIYTVWEHNLFSLEYAAQHQWNMHVRIAALLHDVAKPRVKRGQGPDATFYGHEALGAAVARHMLSRLKFPKKDIEKISRLIRYHMFYYNVDEVTESSVRRLVRNIGRENIDDLLKLRMADRIGSGVPKAQPYKLRHWQYMVEKVSQDPISPKALKVNGNDIMKVLSIAPGPRVGHILSVLLAEVLEDPSLNSKAYLERRAQELHKHSDADLAKLAAQARKAVETVETRQDELTKKKYRVA